MEKNMKINHIAEKDMLFVVIFYQKKYVPPYNISFSLVITRGTYDYTSF
jgi:hypothetical protein